MQLQTTHEHIFFLKLDSTEIVASVTGLIQRKQQLPNICYH